MNNVRFLFKVAFASAGIITFLCFYLTAGAYFVDVQGSVTLSLCLGVSPSPKSPPISPRRPALRRANPTRQMIKVETVDRKPVGKEKERSPEKRQPKDNDRPVVPEPAALNEKGASDDEKIDDSPESKSTSSPIPKPSSTKCDPVGPKIAASSSLSELFKKTTRVLWNEDTRTLSPGVKGFWMVSERACIYTVYTGYIYIYKFLWVYA